MSVRARRLARAVRKHWPWLRCRARSHNSAKFQLWSVGKRVVSALCAPGPYPVFFMAISYSCILYWRTKIGAKLPWTRLPGPQIGHWSWNQFRLIHHSVSWKTRYCSRFHYCYQFSSGANPILNCSSFHNCYQFPSGAASCQAYNLLSPMEFCSFWWLRTATASGKKSNSSSNSSSKSSSSSSSSSSKKKWLLLLNWCSNVLHCLHTFMQCVSLPAHFNAMCFTACTLSCNVFHCLHTFMQCFSLPAHFNAMCFTACTLSCNVFYCLHTLMQCVSLPAHFHAMFFTACTLECNVFHCLHTCFVALLSCCSFQTY